MEIKNLSLKFVYLFMIICFCKACTQNSQDEVTELRSEVLLLHDEVMPLMGDLKSLRTEVLKEADRLVKEDSVINAERINKLRVLAARMDAAFESMFVWMRQYQANQDSMSKDEKLRYLKEQRTMVEKVNQNINASLSTAKNELGKET